jgi:tetratricopeptide (TPR) repeat protein
MKLNLIILLLCGLLTTTLTAQNPENNKILRGKVLFQNSNFTPATGVAVSGIIKLEKEEYANKNYTDSKGQYELKFPLARKGHPVKLTLGKENSKGQELEVVNEKEVSLCVIRANANQEFMIIVCPKGSRDLAARKYYKILKNSAELAYEQMQKELRALNSSQSTDFKSIQQIAGKLEKLQAQLNDSIAIYKEAFAIASINKDGANSRVLKYLKLLDEGKSIQEARKALSVPKAAIDIRNGGKLFRAGFKELKENARAYAATFNYKDAAMAYDTLISLAENLNIDRLEISEYYLWKVLYNQNAGNYHKALIDGQKVITIREKLLDSSDFNLAQAYNAISLVYRDLGNYKKAIDAQQKAIRIYKAIMDPIKPFLAASYNNLSLIYRDLGLFKEALTAQLESLKIQNSILEMDNYSLANSYNNIAVIYQDLGQYKEALSAIQKSITIREDLLESEHPDLATSYNNIAMLYNDLKQYEKALFFQKKSIDIRKATLKQDHPLTAQGYHNLSLIYYNLRKYHKAFELENKSIKIRKTVLGHNHPFLINSYDNLTSIYEALENYDLALTAQITSLNIKKILLEPTNPDLGKSYGRLSLIYKKMGCLKEAVLMQESSLKIEESNPEFHDSHLATSYSYLASLYVALGYYFKAIIVQKKALSIQEEIYDPGNSELANSYVYLAILYKEIKKLATGIHYLNKGYTYFEKSLSRNHRNSRMLLDLLILYQKEYGTSQFFQKKYQKALKSLDTVTKYQKDAEAWNYKGLCNYYLKQYPKAISAYNKSVEIDSTLKKQHYYNNIGTAYVKNNQFAAAKVAFTEYQKLFPKQGQSLPQLGHVLCLAKPKRRGTREFRKSHCTGL